MFAIAKKSIDYKVMTRGIGFTADLLENGKKIGIVLNNGGNGLTFLDLSKGFGTPEHYRLEEAARSFEGMHNYLDHLKDTAEKVIVFPIDRALAGG